MSRTNIAKKQKAFLAFLQNICISWTCINGFPLLTYTGQDVTWNALIYIRHYYTAIWQSYNFSVHNYGKWLKAKLKHGVNQLFSTTNQLKLSHGINSKPTESEKKFNWLVSLPSWSHWHKTACIARMISFMSEILLNLFMIFSNNMAADFLDCFLYWKYTETKNQSKLNIIR